MGQKHSVEQGKAAQVYQVNCVKCGAHGTVIEGGKGIQWASKGAKPGTTVVNRGSYSMPRPGPNLLGPKPPSPGRYQP